MHDVGQTYITMHKTTSLERHILNNSSIAFSSCCEVELSSFTTLQAPASANTAAFFFWWSSTTYFNGICVTKYVQWTLARGIVLQSLACIRCHKYAPGSLKQTIYSSHLLKEFAFCHVFSLFLIWIISKENFCTIPILMVFQQQATHCMLLHQQ